jgi:hypothetical protein
MSGEGSFVNLPIVLVKMLDFFQGIHPGVVAEHREHGAGYAPLRLALHRCLSQFVGCFGALVVNDFVVASVDVASSQMLKRLSGLDQKAARGQFDNSLFPVASPHGKARILALPMDGQEADVTVEASEHSAQVVFL